MCEIQLRTCCGCTLCNPGRLRGSSSQEATLQATSKQKSQWPGPPPGAGHVPSHSQRSESSPWSLIITHALRSSRSVSPATLRSVEKGIQRTLLDTTVYNSCPAPKIECSNRTNCFVAKIEAWSKGCMLADKGGLSEYIRDDCAYAV